MHLLSIAEVQSLRQWNLHVADTTKVHSRADGVGNLTDLGKVGWRLRENLAACDTFGGCWRCIPFSVDAWTSDAKPQTP